MLAIARDGKEKALTQPFPQVSQGSFPASFKLDCSTVETGKATICLTHTINMPPLFYVVCRGDALATFAVAFLARFAVRVHLFGF